MSILDFRSHHASSGSLRAAAATLWADMVQQWRIHRADQALQGMSDDMLHDIGVARSEIADVTRHGRPGRR